MAVKVKVRKGIRCPNCFSKEVEHDFHYISEYKNEGDSFASGYTVKNMEMHLKCLYCGLDVVLKSGDIKL